MSVDRTPQTRYFNDKDRLQRSAKENLRFILANKNHLLKVRSGNKLLAAAESMNLQKEPLTPNQMNFIESILEKVWKGAGYDSAPSHHDIKKSLRY